MLSLDIIVDKDNGKAPESFGFRETNGTFLGIRHHEIVLLLVECVARKILKKKF